MILIESYILIWQSLHKHTRIHFLAKIAHKGLK